MNKAALISFIPLLAALVVVFWLDPRTPQYRSSYDPAAADSSIANWFSHLNEWPRAPRYDFFDFDAATGRTRPVGKPEFAQKYAFGKYRYALDVQIREDRLYYVSWGVDEQQRGGAWTAVGEGTRQPDGRWFTVWSCLDLTELGSNGGGAWLEFSPDMRRIFVRYYHDTLPFGSAAIEEGEAEALPLPPERKLEGRIFTYEETLPQLGDKPFVLVGRVVDQHGQGVAAAAVKRRAAGRIETHSDARGFFRLELEKIEQLTLVCAGKLGYANGAITLDQQTAFAAVGAQTGQTALATIVLHKSDDVDHRNYEYTPPQRLERSGATERYAADKHLYCGNCHRGTYDEWKTSRHATMAKNPLTSRAFSHDAMPVALVRGDTTDNCTPCHSPSLASTLHSFNLNGMTLLDATGVHLEGNHCDFCHKIEAVTDPFKPGLAGSVRLLRPNPADERVPGKVKRVFGPLPDVTYLFMGASYNALFQTGALCAGCHEHKLENGIAGQGTYSEWKQTKYAQPGADYKECQACHMPVYSPQAPKPIRMPDGSLFTPPSAVTNDERKNNGREIAISGTRYRPFHEGHRHDFPGSDSASMISQAIAMRVETRRDGDSLLVDVTLENTGAGHALPSGHGLKRLVLVVTGRQRAAEVFDGARMLPPEESLEGEVRSGVVIGRRFFGQSAAEAASSARGGAANWAVPYWRAQHLESDTRLWPGKPQTYNFRLTGAENAQVKLIYRRASPTWLRELGLSPKEGTAGAAPLDTIVAQWR